MPLYEYECPEHGKFEKRRDMCDSDDGADCPTCGLASPRVQSAFSWKMGWKFLKERARRSEPAPNTPAYVPKWDD